MRNESVRTNRSHFKGARPAVAIAVLFIAGGVAINLSTGTANAATKHKHRNSTSASGTAAGTKATTTTTVAPAVALATNCDKTKLELHTGFQDAPRCVTTEFGEVSEADKNPTLLITKAPTQVKANEAFEITVSTRNLLRDRFLAAAAGGYYLETSLLTSDGITRGHFHTACRMLDLGTGVAPEPDEVPAFFKATEDGKGGQTPDSVTIEIPAGLPTQGTAQCAVWAGDGSHRIPMMQRANEIPAFDSVRLTVKGVDNNNPAATTTTTAAAKSSGTTTSSANASGTKSTTKSSTKTTTKSTTTTTNMAKGATNVGKTNN